MHPAVMSIVSAQIDAAVRRQPRIASASSSHLLPKSSLSN